MYDNTTAELDAHILSLSREFDKSLAYTLVYQVKTKTTLKI